MPQLNRSLSADKKTSPPPKTPEEIEREAYEKGFSAGEAAGYEMGKQKMDLVVHRLETILDEFSALKETIITQFEPQALLLAIALARKILKEEISTHPEIVAKMVKEALNKICKIGPITLKMNQSLFDYLGEKKEELLAIYPDLNFELNNQIPEGGVVVHSLSEEIQTDLNFQLSHIVEELRTNLGHA
jgi:flagellar assembly protein FliH